jgi:hypothetical protein
LLEFSRASDAADFSVDPLRLNAARRGILLSVRPAGMFLAELTMNARSIGAANKAGGKNMRSDELFYFLAGISVGVIAALLLTPYSGEEARQYLRDRVDEGRERAGEMFERGKEFVGSGRDYGRRNYAEKL